MGKDTSQSYAPFRCCARAPNFGRPASEFGTGLPLSRAPPHHRITLTALLYLRNEATWEVRDVGPVSLPLAFHVVREASSLWCRLRLVGT